MELASHTELDGIKNIFTFGRNISELYIYLSYLKYSLISKEGMSAFKTGCELRMNMIKQLEDHHVN